uniref:Uncharacterized protein n=1 Tax=Arundo donax TaxID=35708 RepID=A0A0A9BE52_ARUDO
MKERHKTLNESLVQVYQDKDQSTVLFACRAPLQVATFSHQRPKYSEMNSEDNS